MGRRPAVRKSRQQIGMGLYSWAMKRIAMNKEQAPGSPPGKASGG